MQDDFIPGQRWLSDAEAGLGMGTVLESDARRVHMAFPASGEQRIYARHSAPLTRVLFSAGDRVEDRTGRRLTVVEAQRQGLMSYVVSDDDGATEILSETQLSDRLRLDRPQDKLLSGRIDRDLWFDLRYRTWLRVAQAARSPVSGLIGPRVGLIPHQLHIAAEAAGRDAPRVLLADEVGLGKTIEAGLILHKMLLEERVRRVLILVPESLIHQWLVEMLRRFNLRCALFDAQRFAAADTDNPFQAEQQVLCSQELLCSSPAVARAALDGEWDMLVVDEAHHLHWDEQGSSLEYDLVQALAEQTPAVLLLTATPEQLGRTGHFARLRLLDPHRFPDYGAFLDEERAYEPVARLASRLLDGEALGTQERALLRQLLGGEAEGDTAVVIHKLLDRHGTGRVLFRNTRAAIKGFPGRRLEEHPLPQPDAYLQAGCAAVLTPEACYQGEWARVDPRLPWLAATLRELRPEKVLVICARAGTVLDLAEALQRIEGIHPAVFHEGMEIVERDRAAAYFADLEEGTQLLICSEIGSEGRNFQFAHHLVLFDLPLQPDLLEQRIGRLDRIGQSETIRIHVPYLEGGAGETLLRWYRDGLHAFRAISPAAAAVYERLAGELDEVLESGSGADQLIDRAAALTEQLNVELEAGRDRLLELHSHRPAEAERLLRQIAGAEAEAELRTYLEGYWDAFGVKYESGPGHSTVLHPGRHMLHDRFPGLPADGVTATFGRADALAHEEREYLTWEHPMVRGAMEMLTSGDLGDAALTVVSHPDFRPGTPLLELLYLVECSAPAELGAGRFLPPTCIRLLLDARGADRAAELSHEALQGQCLVHKRRLAETLLKTLSDTLRQLFEQGAALAEGAGRQIVDTALVEMRQQLGDELARLRGLAAVNPSVRDDELEQLEARRALLAQHMGNVRVRLDAARVVVMQ